VAIVCHADGRVVQYRTRNHDDYSFGRDQLFAVHSNCTSVSKCYPGDPTAQSLSRSQYISLGELTQIIDPANNQTQYVYDTENNLAGGLGF
jgi:hypothetical protein